MKDFGDMLKQMTNQELEDHIEKQFSKLIRGLSEAEARTCEAAESGVAGMDEANAFITEAHGYAKIAKGRATMAGRLTPDVTVNFGGK